MKKNDLKINVNGEVLSCTVDYASENQVPDVISIHGGGKSGKDTTEYLSKVLTENGRSIVRFSHSGHGESSGTIKNSSLKKRFEEAVSVIKHFEMKEPLTIIGSSMGGFIASKLVERFEVEFLILFCPAAYSIKAWNLRFSDGFTEIIRKKNSYMETDLIGNLKNFSGRAILFKGENDNVIPDEVIEIYSKSIENLKIVTLEDCPHTIHKWAVKNNKENNILSIIKDFIS